MSRNQSHQDFKARREEISRMMDEGVRWSRIAAKLDCSRKLLYKVQKLKEAGQSLDPKKAPGRPVNYRVRQ